MLDHPRRTLAAALVCFLVLGAIGLSVEERLSPTSLGVGGTESAKGDEMLQRHFGESSPFTILLEGPSRELDRQGPALIRELRRNPTVTTVSPWDRGSVAGLRPAPRKALILADFHVPLAEAMRHVVPEMEQTLEERISPPVTATQSGFASISRALQQESLDATERGELLAGPIVLIVLLLVFRSLIAAVIPLLFGAVTVLAGRGVLSILTSVMTIDGLSLVVCTMMGLALGVDYSLLMVSRFREELRRGASPLEAARLTQRTAGRTTIFAGSTLLISIGLSAFIQPGSLLTSLAVTLVVVATISVLLSWLVVPIVLAMLGENVNRWGLAQREAEGSRLMVFVNGALRNPRLAVVLITLPMLVLAAPAIAFKTGAPGLDELPSDSPARLAAERIDAAVGAGWEAPFVIVAASERGTITAPRRLDALGRWQRRIAADPGVQAVIGPGAITKRVAPLRRFGGELLAEGKGGRLGELRRLGPNLGRAAGGVALLRGGLSRASYGAGLLGEGSGKAEAGAGALADGLAQAADGGEQAVGALGRLAEGSGRLAEGQRTALLGAISLKFGLQDLLPNLRDQGLARARALRDSLSAAAASDPSLADDAAEAQQLVDHLAANRNEVKRLRGIAERLNAGQGKLAAGGQRLNRGAQRLAGAAAALPNGLKRLSDGAGRLAEGLSRLRGGADTLEEKLAEGFHRSYPLQSGLRRAAVRVTAGTRFLDRNVERLRRNSPRLFDSGYFVLSALDGAAPLRREQVGEVVSLSNGDAARMLVIPTSTFNTAGSRAVHARLRDAAGGLAREAGVEALVTGGPAILNDYGSETKGQLPLVIGTIIVATFLLLVAILRAPLLSAVAVVLNLGTVGAAIGVMTLLLEVPAGYPLGGHTYVDTVGAAAIFGVTFGLSIDYAVFLIARMRESYERYGDNKRAIAFGLEKTAGVITGAAAIMAAVFISFATAPIGTVSQMGTGLTVAVLLDATVVRIVLLPAVMLLLGDRVWWVPKWLDRVLPELNVHGEKAA